MIGPYAGWVEQIEFEIGGVKIGGLPGKNPAFLVGSIFYHGDKLLYSKEGDFDKVKAKIIIEETIDIVQHYGLSLGIDVVFPSKEAVGKILPFMAEQEAVLLLDAPDPEIRMHAYMMANELGIQDKTIANGIYPDSSEDELKALADSGIKAAVLLAFDPRNPLQSIDPHEKIRLLEEKLFKMAEEAGIEKLLIDAVVLDPASIGLSAEAIYIIKQRYGYPAGCAPANALGPVSKKKVGIDGMYSIHGSAAVLLRVMGADFIMYGPLSRIKYVAQSIAMADSLLGYIMKRRGESISRNHPLRKFLKNIQRLFTAST